VILGDLNCDGLKNNCVEYKTLDRFLNEMNLTQLIKSPTRITDSTQSLLDVIIIIIITILPAPKRAFQKVITNHLYATNNIYTPTNIHIYIQTQIKIL
jgi:hypothetical protein